MAVVDQEVHCRRKNDFVAEITAREKQNDREKQKWEEKAFFIAVQSRWDESPDLIEKNWAGYKNADNQTHFDLDIEGIRRIQVNESGIVMIFCEGRLNRRLHNGEYGFNFVPAKSNTHGNAQSTLECTTAELFQMLQKAHGAGSAHLFLYIRVPFS